jgi:hypothetical protein
MFSIILTTNDNNISINNERMMRKSSFEFSFEEVGVESTFSMHKQVDEKYNFSSPHFTSFLQQEERGKKKVICFSFFSSYKTLI